MKVNKLGVPKSTRKVPGKSQETSEAGEKGLKKSEKYESQFEVNANGEQDERTGSRPVARLLAWDSDSPCGSSPGEVQLQRGRAKSGETKRALYKSKTSQQGKRDFVACRQFIKKKKTQQHGRKRRYRLGANTDGELAGQKRSQKTFGFPISESDSVSGYPRRFSLLKLSPNI